MKPLNKLFISQNNEDTTHDMRIINGLIKQVDEAAKKVFTSNTIELLNEPITNVIEAVWGAQTDKSLATAAQRRIDSIIRPMIRKINDDIESEDLTGAKNCIIDALIKRLAIWEILFTIQCYKLGTPDPEQSKSTGIYNLVDIKVAGHA
jgi:hypothetical protein